jgi:hypothetical protein
MRKIIRQYYVQYMFKICRQYYVQYMFQIIRQYYVQYMHSILQPAMTYVILGSCLCATETIAPVYCMAL